jgi:hypothetical protein
MEITLHELKLLKRYFENNPGSTLYLHRNRETGALTSSPFQTPFSVCYITEDVVDLELSDHTKQLS